MSSWNKYTAKQMQNAWKMAWALRKYSIAADNTTPWAHDNARSYTKYELVKHWIDISLENDTTLAQTFGANYMDNDYTRTQYTALIEEKFTSWANTHYTITSYAVCKPYMAI